MQPDQTPQPAPAPDPAIIAATKKAARQNALQKAYIAKTLAAQQSTYAHAATLAWTALIGANEFSLPLKSLGLPINSPAEAFFGLVGLWILSVLCEFAKAAFEATYERLKETIHDP